MEQAVAGGRRGSAAVLVCVCVCTVLVVGFVASINLAVPQLAASGLHPSSSALLWIVDSYVIVFACLVIPAGALGDRFGRKGVLIAGLLAFALGAAISASAPSVAVLLVGRAITGLGAACVLPNGLAVVVHATEPSRRPRALAIWAATSGVGGVVGNVGGGALLAAGSWRLLFIAVTPIAVACALWVAIGTHRSPRNQRSIGALAAGLLTAATLALLLGITQGPERGWASAPVMGAFLAAVLLLLAWWAVEIRSRHPMLDPRLFLIAPLRAASLGMLIVFFGMFGFFYLNASLLQYGRGFTVLEAGIAVVPMTVPLIVGTRYVPAIVDRFGIRTVLGVAFALVAGGLWGLAGTLSRPYWCYAVFLVVVGTGVMLALPALTAEIAAAIPTHQAGVAGGLQSTTRELGSALGVAVIGTIVTSHFIATMSSSAPSASVDGHAPRTVAEASAAIPDQLGTVIDAYTSSAASALRIVAVFVLAIGALIVAEFSWATTRQRSVDTSLAADIGASKEHYSGQDAQ